MSLNDIQLPSIALHQLYNHSLIELKPDQITESKSTSKAYVTLGNNNRRVLILVDSEDTLYLPDDQLNFLMGILAACNLTMEDVAILNVKKNTALDYKLLSEQLKPEKLFLFGVVPAQINLPIDFPNYQIQHYNNQTYLTAPILSQFQDNKPEKMKLWACLKQIFAL